jgi:hypothetical protein
MSVPIILLRQCLVDTVVEVFVVGEDNVSTDIVELVVAISRVFYNWNLADAQSLLE